MTQAPLEPFVPEILPPGVTSRFVDGVNGLRMHILEAGDPTAPLVLLLHGFPELAWSWRKVLPVIAAAGYHVVAPDQRGYGRTTGWDADYDGDLASFRMLNVVRDAMGLVAALGHNRVELVAGHDFGSPVAAWSALLRPDIYRRLALLAGPFGGPPRLGASGGSGRDIDAELAALPRPRKNYHRYYSTRQADPDMCAAPAGMHGFLRAYYHHKSADWAGNRPFPLKPGSAAELAQMPTYYIMDLDETMPATVAKEAPTPAEIAACGWLTEAELAIYASEYERTGFQGGLQWYRCGVEGVLTGELELFSGRTIEVPSMFIAGAQDWCVQQIPGMFDRMRQDVLTNLVDCQILEGAGHWVQQEQPGRTNALLLELLATPA